MIKITIPRKVLTINHVYGFRGFRKFIKKEGRELKEFIIETIRADYIKNQEELSTFTDALSVTINVYENWLTKDKKIKRKDLDNRAKFLLDAVFEGLQLDDKLIYKLILLKVQSTEEKSIVYIERLNKNDKSC